MGRGKRYVPPSHGDVRIVKRFIFYLDLPVEDGLDKERQARWLETVYIWQRYKASYSDDGVASPGHRKKTIVNSRQACLERNGNETVAM